MKPSWVGDFGAEYKLIVLIFWGERHYLISYAHAEHTRKFLICVTVTKKKTNTWNISCRVP